MERDEVFDAWAPRSARWSNWVKPVVFAHIQETWGYIPPADLSTDDIAQRAESPSNSAGGWANRYRRRSARCSKCSLFAGAGASRLSASSALQFCPRTALSARVRALAGGCEHERRRRRAGAVLKSSTPYRFLTRRRRHSAWIRGGASGTACCRKPACSITARSAFPLISHRRICCEAKASAAQ